LLLRLADRVEDSSRMYEAQLRAYNVRGFGVF